MMAHHRNVVGPEKCIYFKPAPGSIQVYGTSKNNRSVRIGHDEYFTVDRVTTAFNECFPTAACFDLYIKRKSTGEYVLITPKIMGQLQNLALIYYKIKKILLSKSTENEADKDKDKDTDKEKINTNSAKNDNCNDINKNEINTNETACLSKFLDDEKDVPKKDQIWQRDANGNVCIDNKGDPIGRYYGELSATGRKKMVQQKHQTKFSVK